MIDDLRLTIGAVPGPAISAVSGLVWLYAILSVVLLLACRATRFYPLYLLKSAWALFTILAFTWVVLLSGTTNQEFGMRPAGVFGELRKYPEVFRESFGVNAWWLPFILWIPVWGAGGLAGRGTSRRRWLRALLAVLSAPPLCVAVRIAASFDWSPYTHFAANYTHAWRVARMGDYFFNSVLVSLSAVGLLTVMGAMGAYALTRLIFPGRRTIMTLLIVFMAIPGFLSVVPLFVMMRHWVVGNFSFMDSRFGLAILYVAGSLPFTIFLLSAFFRTLPSELAEAAALDGAGPWRIFAEVYFPLAAPGLATAAIFNFLGIWNEYNFALIFVTNPDFRTLPVGLYNLQVSQQYAVNWPAMFAGIVLLCLPTFLIFVTLQERIVAGLTIGAVKG